MHSRLSCLALLCLLTSATFASGCKSNSSPDDGDGGSAGAMGGMAAEGPAAGGASGAGAMPPAGGQAGQAMPTTACKNVTRDTTRPAPVTDADAAPTASLPIKVTFDTATDLASKFAVTAQMGSVVQEAGAIKVPAGKRAVLTFDSEPDKTPTDTFESFTASVTFRSSRAPALWFGFASDQNRNDGEVIRFSPNKGRDGPAGISDVDAFWFYDRCLLTDLGPAESQTCFDEPLCAGPRRESYAWTAFDSSDKPQTIKVTVVVNKASKAISAWAEMIDKDGAIVDGVRQDWVNVAHTTGEVSFGLAANAEADLFVDEVEIKQAEALPDPGVISVDGAPIHIWIPKGMEGKPIKGLLISEPGLVRNAATGDVDTAMFKHLRHFAQTWGWALVGGVRSNLKEFGMFFQADLDKLVAKTGRQELKTVPVFIHSLLDTLAYQALSDETFNKRLIGFVADKPRFGGDVNQGLEETFELYPVSDVGRSIPGLIIYTSVVASRFADRMAGAVSGMWGPQRFYPYLQDQTKTEITGALWTMTIHGMQTHAVVDSWTLYLSFLQELIKLRTNNNDGKLPLKPVDRSGGHLGSSPFSSITTTSTMSTLSPFTQFPAPPASAATVFTTPQPDFVFGKATALVWQAFDYYRQSLEGSGPILLEGGKLRFVPKKVWWKEAPKHGKAGDSRTMILAMDASLDGWKKIDFFDASATAPMTPLATVQAGAAAQHTFSNLSAGAHNFIAHVTDANNVVHATFPVMTVIEP